ncbi:MULTISPECIES: DUF2061 domain-containing protein [unclassified Sphingomonas]|uniref:DUF2061 domain-containing protein n=1 Tax=unclassified Sphingomonas TaxID=196159 RepID=UPI0006FDF0BA|nr:MULTISPECIES: DUF2061 domain-containing protein [unclassified Sphingomonas]KQM24653.1 hypothetical protein ASE58_14645 [Sphingomonas sp. Leaf9]KQM42312.1 hypothetical protein ASE57_14650 [Sphingomonas sp. Leaf11]
MFLFKGLESHPRSLVKAVSWRTVGSIDTFVLGLFFSGSAKLAGAIAGTEVLTKILLFYFHERAWSLVRWGHRPDPAADAAPDSGEPAPTALPATG